MFHVTEDRRLKIELVLRLAAMVLIASILAVASGLSKVVPPHLQYLVGIMSCTLPLTLAKFQSTVLLIFPSVVVVLLLAMMGASALLSAATLSDGALCGVYAVYACLLTGFYFGKMFETTYSLANILICMSGMFALSFRGLVQNGLELARFQELDADTCRSLGILEQCIELSPSSPSSLSLTDQLKALLPYAFPVDNEMFAGQTATVAVDPVTNEIVVAVPGGLWIVRGLWTWSGTENGLAFNQNFLIVFGWIFAIMAAVMFVPPVRTQRQKIAEYLAPAALRYSADLVVAAAPTSPKNGEEDAPAPASASSASENKDVSELVHLLQTFNRGKGAFLTLFEPRLAHLCTQDLLAPLQELLLKTHWATVGSGMLRRILEQRDMEHFEGESEAETSRQLYMDTLNRCATALETNDASGLQLQQATENDVVTAGGDNDNDKPTVFQRLAQDLEKATVAWVLAYTAPCASVDCSKQGLKNAVKSCLVGLIGPLLVIGTQFGVIFKWQQPNLRAALWSLELATGFVALFTMSVYWDRYSNFAIEKPNGTVGAVFHGWQLLAYSFAWRPTLEGTIQKGMARLVGTVIGGFLAWLGVIVCSWNFDDILPDMNPYALVAWLTITTSAIAWLATDNGIEAFSGITYDYGMAYNYCAVVQALIMLEVNNGSGDRNDLISNRICSNVAGIAMAILVSAVPPYIRGNDPVMLQDALDELRKAFSEILQSFMAVQADDGTVSANDKLLDEKWRATVLDKARMVIRVSLFKLKDPSRLQLIPFLRVDKTLQPSLEACALMTGLMEQVLHFAVQCLEDDATKAQFYSDDVHIQIAHILAILDEKGEGGGFATEESLPIDIDRDEKIILLLVLARSLALELRNAKDKVVP